MSLRLSPLKSPVSWIDHGTLETNDRRSAPLCYKKKGTSNNDGFFVDRSLAWRTGDFGS